MTRSTIFGCCLFLLSLGLVAMVRADDAKPATPAANSDSTQEKADDAKPADDKQPSDDDSADSKDDKPADKDEAADKKDEAADKKVDKDKDADEKEPAAEAKSEEPVDPNNPGQSDLDQATQLKVAAEGLADLNEAIDLMESALEKGLDEGNTAFAHELLVASLLQRATLLSAAILDRPLNDARQLQIRQFALSDLQRAVSLNDNLPEAHLLLGRLQVPPLGDPRAARREFTKVIEAAEVELDQRAMAYALRGTVQEDPERQLADLNKAIEIEATKPDYLRLRSQHYFAQEKFDPALTDIESALEMDADHASSHELKGMILLGLERYDDALTSFDRASELAPEAPRPYQERAELYRQQGNLDKAIEQLTKSLELSPGNPATLLLRSSLYFQHGKPDLAIADVEEVTRRQPQLLQAHLMRAELYAASNKVGEAIDQLEKLAKLAPKQPQLLQQLGTYCLIGGRPRRAIEVFSVLVELEPENSRAVRSRGDAYLNIGNHAEAVADLTRALELDDQDQSVLNNLAWVLATSPDDNLRDGKRAIELATKAAEASAYQTPHILSTLAAAYAETGDYESAIKWSQKAVELGKDDEAISQLEGELASYREGKPVRERQEAEEKPAGPDEGDQTFAPASAAPAPARTADF